MTCKQVALRIDLGWLRSWIKPFTGAPAGAFPGEGHVGDQERRRLRRDLDHARMERAMLQKAMGIFSRRPPK